MKTCISFYLVVIITLLTFNSCNHGEDPVSSGDNLHDQIGYWHNMAVASVFNDPEFFERLTAGSIAFSDIREKIMKDLSGINPQVFKFQSIKSSLAWSDEILTENRILYTSPSANIRHLKRDPVNYSAVFEYLHDQDEIGDLLYNRLIELNKKVVQNEVSRDEILKLSGEMGDLPLSIKEKSYVDVFNQVLYASSSYWGNAHARTQDNRTLGIIWADAAGGLYGMLCGPVCSIIEAAAFSTIVAIQE
jgi:hypothetical protein